MTGPANTGFTLASTLLQMTGKLELYKVRPWEIIQSQDDHKGLDIYGIPLEGCVKAAKRVIPGNKVKFKDVKEQTNNKKQNNFSTT